MLRLLTGLLLLLPMLLLAEPATEPVNKTLVWPDGTRYVGGVTDGKRTGKGTIFWQDGTRFVGQFENDMRNGPGTMIMPDGKVYSGIFQDDELVSATEAMAPDAPEETVDTSTPDMEQPAAAAEPETSEQPQTPTTISDDVVTEITEQVEADLTATLDSWSEAWSSQDVAGYIGFYSDSFDIPRNLDRRDWEALRRSRLTRPRHINIALSYERFNLVRDDVVDVYFEQSYGSDLFEDQTRKRVRLNRENQAWRIVQEKTLAD
jgi:hypothetical protein